MKKLLFLVVLVISCGLSALCQGIRYDNVALLPSGKGVKAPTVAVCSYPADTNTQPCSPLVSIYSNVSLTTPLTNPMTGDQYGNYGFWSRPGHYVVQIYGASIGTTTRDVFLPEYNVFNVQAFGATGNQTTDDTSAIQAAITAADSVGGVVFFPPGIYKVSSTLTSTNWATSFKGSGKEGTTTLYYTGSTGPALFLNDAFTAARAGFVRDLAIGCGVTSPSNGTQALPSSTTIGIEATSAIGRLYQDVTVGACGTGIELYQTPGDWTEESNFQQVMLLTNFYGLSFYGLNGGNGDSYAYTLFDGYCENYSTQGGACINVYGAWLYHSRINLRVNEIANPSVLAANIIESNDYGKIENDEIHVYGEGADGNPVIAVSPLGSVALSGDAVGVDGSVTGAIWEMPTAQGGSIPWTASQAYSVGQYIQPSGCDSGYGYLMVQTAGTSGTSQPSWNCGELDQMTTDGAVTWRFVGAYPGANGGIFPALADYINGPEIILPQQYCGFYSSLASPCAVKISTQLGYNESITDGDTYGGIGFVQGANISHPVAYGYQNDTALFEVDKKYFETPLSAADRVFYIDTGGNIHMNSGLIISATASAPTGSCTPNGSLDANINGSSGSTLYVCVSGSWVNLK